MTDSIKITILEDGQIKIETDQIGAANHCSADELLGMIARLAGGEKQTTKKRGWHEHIVQGQIIKHRH